MGREIKGEINWQEFKCRCSAINQLLSEKSGESPLTEKQLSRINELENKENITDKQKIELTDLVQRRDKPKEIVLSDTCIGYLMEHYAYVTEGAIPVGKEFIDNFEKGSKQEAEAIEILSEVDGVVYTKNDTRIYNEFLSGEPDIFLGEHIYKAKVIFDTKVAWDYPGFLKKILTSVSVANKQQVQGYCDITGAGEGFISDVLVNMPDTIINDYKYRLARKLDVIDIYDPSFQKSEDELMLSLNFDRIPNHKKVFKKKVEPFTDFERNRLYEKVKICREWLFNFDEMYKKLNKN